MRSEILIAPSTAFAKGTPMTTLSSLSNPAGHRNPAPRSVRPTVIADTTDLGLFRGWGVRVS